MSFKYWKEVIDDFEQLFETGEGYDVIIHADENENVKELHTHSNILHAGLNIFARHYRTNGHKKGMGDLSSKNLTFLRTFLQLS
jgi:hypothetical protein